MNGIKSDSTFLLPPVPEQTEKSLAAPRHRHTPPTTAAITRALRQTELLREYRTRLIADVVTGKLDVRETTANLPDESRSVRPT